MMKQETKVQLLPFEIELLSNANLILTKNATLKKLQALFFSLETKQKEIIRKHPDTIPDEVIKITPKISRGENYKGFPWLVLDHPRYFERINVFAIRTMFWWGNFFSITLHLSGRFKNQLHNKLLEKRSLLVQQGFFLCINENEWEHHFQPDNYKMIKDFSASEFENLIKKSSFLKIALKFSLDQLTKMEEILCRNYEEIIRLLD